MSRDNPAPAMDALVGRVYEFRGKKIRNSNMAMLALARSGFDLDALEARILEARCVMAFAMLHGVRETLDALAEDGGLMPRALEFCEDFSEEELGELTAIFVDCVRRFRESMTAYHARGSSAAGNREAAAGISS